MCDFRLELTPPSNPTGRVSSDRGFHTLEFEHAGLLHAPRPLTPRNGLTRRPPPEHVTPQLFLAPVALLVGHRPPPASKWP